MEEKSIQEWGLKRDLIFYENFSNSSWQRSSNEILFTYRGYHLRIEEKKLLSAVSMGDNI